MHQSRPYNIAKTQTGTQKWQPLEFGQWVRLERELLEANTGVIYMVYLVGVLALK